MTSTVQVRDQSLLVAEPGSARWVSDADAPYGGSAFGVWFESADNTLTFLRDPDTVAGYVLAVMDFTLRSDGRLERTENTGSTPGTRTFIYRRVQVD